MGNRAHSLLKMIWGDQYPALSQYDPSECHPRRGCSRSRKPKESCKVTRSHLERSRKQVSGRKLTPRKPSEDLEFANRGEIREVSQREQRELRDKLSRARQLHEKSAKKIEELQKTLNKSSSAWQGTLEKPPTQRGPIEHTSGAAEEEIDMLDADGPRVGSKGKNQSGTQAGDTENTQKSQRPRSSAKKVEVLEQMNDKLAE
ncbi:hypothetical protein MRX96_008486 [Rhipicephalus microplus]